MKLDSPAAMAAADPRLADVFAVILGARDAHVADELLASPEKKFFLTYGLMHFDGIYARLKASDPAYAIIKVEAYHPFVSE